MKISKSFKIYIHIILSLLLANTVLADDRLSKNVIIHDKPINIKELKFKDYNLQEVDLTSKKGNIMILNFWATWCAPCKEEMPSLDKFNVKNPEFLVYPINLEKINQKKTKKFYDDLNIQNLKIFFDPEFQLAKQFKLRGVPTTIFINQKGQEFARVIGDVDFSDKNFIKWLNNFY